MTLLGNIFLGLAALIFFLLISSIHLTGQPRGGDAAVGALWGALLLNLVFLGLMLVVVLVILSKGGFDWVSGHSGTRYVVVLGGLVAAVVTATLGILMRGEPMPMAALFRWASGTLSIAVPLILLAGSMILLNDGLRTTVPSELYRFPLMVVFGVGVMGVVIFILGLVMQSNLNARIQMEEEISFQERNHNRHLADIDSCDVSKDMVFILVLTDANHDRDVRERALAKIKTRADWQEELIRRLDSGWASQVFIFLASNEVDDKQMFAEPVRAGILQQAEAIRASIRRSSHPSHFYPELFSWEIERVIRTVEKFKGLGVDYLPAMRELRAALDEPTSVEKSKLNCTATLDKWISNNQ